MIALTVSSPKQSRRIPGKEGWYPYYAGFSADFAKSALLRYPPVENKPVLDPWNGGGTTTQVCSELGLHSIGFDINPAMIVVAKARRLQSTVKESITPLATELLKATALDNSEISTDADPLAAWLAPKSVIFVRSIEQSIRNHFIPEATTCKLADSVCTERFSDLAAYFYLILFRTVRQLLTFFKTANPTWIRVPEVKHRLRPSRADIEQAFKFAVKETLGSFSDGIISPCTGSLSKLLQEDSRKLPLANGCVGGIVTSPPYLTRLDYAVATGPELAILGYSEESARKLRDSMIGTTTVTASQQVSRNLGGYAGWCLKKIETHDSKASKSYYYKNIHQYLHGLASSLDEATRVLAPHGKMAIVVQDSYYKDVHLDLPRIILEYGAYNGMILVDTHPFHVERHLGCVHQHHRKHTNVLGRVETVVVMQKQPKE